MKFGTWYLDLNMQVYHKMMHHLVCCCTMTSYVPSTVAPQPTASGDTGLGSIGMLFFFFLLPSMAKRMGRHDEACFLCFFCLMDIWILDNGMI